MPLYPLFFSKDVTVGATDTGPITQAFGFDAQFIRIRNASALDVRINLQTSASTGDGILESSGILQGAVPPVAQASFFSTTTSSSKTMNVLAIGHR